MKKFFFRFFLFLLLSIGFFVFIDVIHYTSREYINALIVGAICGLFLLIVFTILFPIRSKKRLEEKNRIEMRNRPIYNKEVKTERHFQETDKIKLDI